eukprot:CAMPEP_0204253796 /NCGR_PEP_ID=MMETSP0468-20130131/2110_1 /ASSEMBLY_ACC=CAM_ASM_000383 /TAXON_ID=2969 /ORGANISM="Oxyrrhis marina" /LENGTH=118 /DNA_ID=CAMNT_0051227425 /DNA_START=9 /DNA_END=365 /DNA_ORIENTATION=-
MPRSDGSSLSVCANSSPSERGMASSVQAIGFVASLFAFFVCWGWMMNTYLLPQDRQEFRGHIDQDEWRIHLPPILDARERAKGGPQLGPLGAHFGLRHKKAEVGGVDPPKGSGHDDES